MALAALAGLTAASRWGGVGAAPIYWTLFGAAALARVWRIRRGGHIDPVDGPDDTASRAGLGSRNRPPSGLAPRASAWLDHLDEGLFLGLLAAILWSLALQGLDRLGQNALTALADPLQINPMEGREAVKAWLLAQGRPLYSDLKGFDYIVTLYGPVYYALTGLVMRVVGPSLAVAREVSLAAGLAALAAMGVLSARLSGRLLPALAVPLALCSAPLMEYAYLARPDMTAWALFLASLALVVPDKRDAAYEQTRLALAGLLMALALLTKQQTWPFFLAALAYLLLQGRARRLAIPYALYVAVAALAGLAALHVWTGGQFLFETVVFPKHMAALASGNSLDVALSRLKEFTREYRALLILFALYLVFAAWTRRTALPALLAILPLPLLVMALCWSGADKNHFFGLLLALYLAVAVLLGRVLTLPAWGLPLAVALLATLAPVRLSPGSLGPDQGRVDRHQAMARRILEEASQIPGPQLSDAEGAYLFLGRPEFSSLKLFDAFETDVLAQVGLWNPKTSDLARAIRQRRFPATFQATTHVDQYLSGMLETFYEPWLTVGSMVIRRPRPGRSVLTVDDFRPDPLISGPVTVRLADFTNLQLDGNAYFDHIKRKTGDAEGRLTLLVESASFMGDVTLAIFPRMLDPNAVCTVVASGEGRESRSWTLVRDKPGPASPFEDRLECPLPGRGRSARFTVTLRGAAELWFSPDRPVTVIVGEDSPADRSGR